MPLPPFRYPWTWDTWIEGLTNVDVETRGAFMRDREHLGALLAMQKWEDTVHAARR